MSDKTWFGRRWKLILNLVTLAALAILVYALRHQLVSTFRNLAHVHGWALLLILPVEAVNYHAQARLYQRLFAIVGNRLPYKYLFKTSLELNFVNHVFPSGGVTGLSYFTLRLRDGEKITSGKATLIHIMKIGLYVITFEILLVFGLLCLAIMGRVNNLVILVAASVMTLLLVGTAGFAYIIGSKRRINWFFLALTRALNRLIQVVRPNYPETINIVKARKLFNDFHDNYEAIKDSRHRLKAPFWYAMLADVTEVMAVYVVYIAFGKWVNIGAVILAYGIANVAGLISVLPGGVGIYEALMTVVLASTGVPAAVSLPVTVMYRVLNTLVQLPPGYYLYQQTLSRSGRLPGYEDGV